MEVLHDCEVPEYGRGDIAAGISEKVQRFVSDSLRSHGRKDARLDG